MKTKIAFKNFSHSLSLAFVTTLFSATYASAAPLPRIVAQSAPSGSMSGIFKNSATNAKIVPHGYNYMQLVSLGSCNQSYNIQNITFHKGMYNAAAVNSFLAQMKYDGFNVVRVFINSSTDNCLPGTYGIAGPSQSSGLYAPYVSNFIDFLLKAKSMGIYIIPVLNEFPSNTGYYTIAHSNLLPNIDGYANFYMQPGYIQAKAAYAADLVRAVKNVNSGELLSTIFSWELQNEIYVFRSQKPFSMTSGTVRTADGLSYNMAVSAERQQAMDANVVNWANIVAAAIRGVDPSAMVSASVFTHSAVGKSGPNGMLPAIPTFNPFHLDDREPARPITMRLYSTLSYTDIHMYNTSPQYNMLSDLNSSEYANMNLATKPLLLGEFGAFKFRYPNLIDAANAMGSFRDQAYSYGFAGSLFWTWDANNQTELWNGAEQQGAINGILAYPKY